MFMNTALWYVLDVAMEINQRILVSASKDIRFGSKSFVAIYFMYAMKY